MSTWRSLGASRPDDSQLERALRPLDSDAPCRNGLRGYRQDGCWLGEASHRLYEFVWGDFCDWYIELAKIPLRDEGGRRSHAGCSPGCSTTSCGCCTLRSVCGRNHRSTAVWRRPAHHDRYPEAAALTAFPDDAERGEFLIGFIKSVPTSRLCSVFRPEKQSVVAVGSEADIQAILDNAEGGGPLGASLT